ncbi:MAG: hypothetical protein CR981_04685 [Proteobacteria bacterium]|nr:MAG: hypothetical protein CR981_04685 [Pseudomonadota bacterium]
MKDYYQILEVTPDSSEEEIRKNYRRLAMTWHPDRNPDQPEAEERFKDIAEAYGVLTDPVKKREYDACRVSGRNGREDGNGPSSFQYSQEEILQDLFRDPRFQQLFRGLLHEFQRSGFRANNSFIRRCFFGGRGGLLFGGLFLFGTLAGPVIIASARKSLPKRKSILKQISSRLGLLLGNQPPVDNRVTQTGDDDIVYITPVSSEELREGTVVQVVSQGPDGRELLRVKIPAGSRNRQRLRLRGKGRYGGRRRGDLYLELEKR